MRKDFWYGKRILIIGASTGIGKALALKLAEFDCTLHLIARRTELIEQYANGSKNIFIYKCDVSDKNEVASTFQKIKDNSSNIDIALLNSGVSVKTEKNDFSSEAAEITFGTNLMGVIYWAELMLPDFIANRKGIFAAVGSLADNRGYSGNGFYSASKAALNLYLESLSVDLKKYDVKIITIKPGFVKTPMTDKNNFKMPFIISADKAAEYIINGIENGKRYIQFPLPTVLLSKLVGALPAFFYEYIASKYEIK